MYCIKWRVLWRWLKLKYERINAQFFINKVCFGGPTSYSCINGIFLLQILQKKCRCTCSHLCMYNLHIHNVKKYLVKIRNVWDHAPLLHNSPPCSHMPVLISVQSLYNVFWVRCQLSVQIMSFPITHSTNYATGTVLRAGISIWAKKVLICLQGVYSLIGWQTFTKWRDQ